MGCGRVGIQLATLLDAEQHEVPILDIDPTSLSRLPPGFGGVAVMGDGTDEEALKEAGCVHEEVKPQYYIR